MTHNKNVVPFSRRFQGWRKKKFFFPLQKHCNRIERDACWMPFKSLRLRCSLNCRCVQHLFIVSPRLVLASILALVPKNIFRLLGLRLKVCKSRLELKWFCRISPNEWRVKLKTSLRPLGSMAIKQLPLRRNRNKKFRIESLEAHLY